MNHKRSITTDAPFSLEWAVPPTRRRSHCGQHGRQHVHDELTNRYPSLLLHNFRILNFIFTTTWTTKDNKDNFFN